MNILQYVPYVLLFAVATAVVYAWGLYRAGRQQHDLTQLLSSKGVTAIRRALRRRGPLTRAELAPVVKDLTASQPFSRQRLAVTDPEPFLDSLLPYMVRQRLIDEEQAHGKTVYRYRK